MKLMFYYLFINNNNISSHYNGKNYVGKGQKYQKQKVVEQFAQIFVRKLINREMFQNSHSPDLFGNKK